MSTGEGHEVMPETKAGVAAAEHGLVLLDGPDGISVTMTADAAEGTARSLTAAADEARQQKSDDEGR